MFILKSYKLTIKWLTRLTVKFGLKFCLFSFNVLFHIIPFTYIGKMPVYNSERQRSIIKEGREDLFTWQVVDFFLGFKQSP